MADLDFTIGVNTNQAERNVDRLKKSVGGLGITFGDLRKVIGGLALGSVVLNTIRWADAIQDVTDATGIATSSVLGFQQAVQESGGSLEGANNALLRLVQSIGEAREGSKSAQDAFAKVNITLGELRSLSQQAIFSKVIAGLSEINDVSRRAAIAADIFGKTLRGVSIDKVTSNVDAYTTANVENAKAVQTAADAQERFEKAVTLAQKAFLTSIEPTLRKLSEFLDGMNENSKAVQRFFDIAYEAGKWALIAASITLVGRGIWVIYTAFRAASAAASALGITFRGLLQAFKNPLTRNNIIKNLEQLPGIGSKAKAMFVALGGSIDFLSKHFGKLAAGIAAAAGGLTEFITGSKEAARIKIQPAPYTQGGPQGPRRLSPEIIEQIRAEAKAREEEAVKQKALLSEQVRQRLELVAAQKQQLEDARKQAFEEMQSIINAEKQRDLMEDIATLNRVMNTEMSMKQLAAQNELIGLYGREYEFKQELLAIDAERESQIASIKERLISMGDDISMNDLSRAEREIELAQYVADERLRIFKDRVAKEQAIEGSALEGVKAALAELANSVTPFNVAQESTRKLFDGMMNGLEEFATTGKLKFKDFALSLIRDLLLMQLRAQATQMFSGLGGFFTSLFAGRAAGGPVTGNTPYVVGEKGPELFVPKSSGTIIPNDKMSGNQSSGGPVTNVYNNYSISAIDSQSVAQFFAQNRKMALGAVTMAQKELSYGS